PPAAVARTFMSSAYARVPGPSTRALSCWGPKSRCVGSARMSQADTFGGWEPAYTAALAADSVALAGYYNHNYAVSHNGQTVLVRIPIDGSPAMDVRVLPAAVTL